MQNINEEKLVDIVLRRVVGKDIHNPKGYIELSSSMAQQALEGIIYGLIRENEDLVEASIKTLKFSLFNFIESNKDNCIVVSDPSGDPEND